ncbi:rhodanese-like domain-containing protein [Coleofasciculus sp. E1-EBD-02]|uniref:rhodanese-like domain-containing protein n=1 Tax=Coleofasciculus sp. E1-EBD-02 TaxID=3068481 RepID=UPI0032FC7341
MSGHRLVQAGIRVNLSQNPYPFWFTAFQGKHSLNRDISLSNLVTKESALTILDIRDRAAFNQARIRGAIPMPMEELPDRATASLEPQREIYLFN